MELILYQVDAFTDRLFRGNPAAVCPLSGGWLPDEHLQAIAQENNLSETAFFLSGDGEFHLRWFTPVKEVNLCGHATLATAHVLYEHLQYTEPRITFQTLSGPLLVEKRDDWYVMNFPVDELKLVPTPPVLITALGMEPIETYRGREDYLAILDSPEDVERLQPNFRSLLQLEGRGVIVSAPGRDTDIVSRCFYPNYGIDEDPVTGSAHTTLAPYWSRHLNRSELTALQASQRTGRLRLRMLSERVEISGQAVTYLEGRIRV